MNKVLLIGRLAKDPELRYTQSGTAVANFTLAVNRRYNPNGEQEADFINCVAWRQTAEFITRFFRKGNRIALQGSLQSRKYTANDGSNRTVYEVVIDNAEFCEPKGGQSAAPAPGYDSQIPQQPKPAFSTASTGDFEEILSDEELPF